MRLAPAFAGVGEIPASVIDLLGQLRLLPERIAAARSAERSACPNSAAARRAIPACRHSRDCVRRRAAGCFGLQDIEDDHQHARSEDEGADGRDHVQQVPGQLVRIGEDAPRHAEQAGQMHRQEGDVEADEHQPEGEPAEPVGQLPAVDSG